MDPNFTFGMPDLAGIRVEVSAVLHGAKKAVLQGKTLYVSPAMYALMRDATVKELEYLLKHLPYVDLGPNPFDRFSDGIGFDPLFKP